MQSCSLCGEGTAEEGHAAVRYELAGFNSEGPMFSFVAIVVWGVH